VLALWYVFKNRSVVMTEPPSASSML
jgi:hypothetical protein